MSGDGKSYTVGITGGIGAGKSVVSRILRSMGYPVFDCDAEAKSLMVTDPALVRDLTRVCGDAIYLPDGSLDRPRLATMIFNDAAMLGKVNSFVHTAVRREFIRRASGNAGINFVEAAVMVSSGLAEICDELWLVDASEDVRFQRASERSPISPEDLRARMAAQRNEFTSLEESGVPVRIIDNSSGSSLLSRIDRLLSEVVDRIGGCQNLL